MNLTFPFIGEWAVFFALPKKVALMALGQHFRTNQGLSPLEMLISVIIPTHNRAAMLREAIDSVLNQEPCGADIELIIVDDDSTDDTPAIIASYPSAKYVRTRQGNAGGSRNVGIAEAAGDWIAFLDDDDAWLPGKLKANVKSIQENPNAGILFSAARICDYQLTPGGVWGGPDLSKHPTAYEASLDDMPSTSAVLIRRDVIKSVGVFDSTVPRAEDRDLWFRLVLSSFECISDTDPLILYRVRPTANGNLIYQSYKDTIKVFLRYFVPGAPMRPTWKRRQQVLWRIKGWYAAEILEAAKLARRAGETSNAMRFVGFAFRMSPIHAMKKIVS